MYIIIYMYTYIYMYIYIIYMCVFVYFICLFFGTFTHLMGGHAQENPSNWTTKQRFTMGVLRASLDGTYPLVY